MISSTHNPRIQWVRLLQSSSRQRREEGAWVVEGVRLAEEALSAGWPARLVLATEDLSPRGQIVLEGFARQGAPVEQVTPAVLRHASDTETPQGILAVLEQRSLPVPQPLDFALIPDGIRDPGNLGTILRTAAAAGVQAVFLPPGAADAFAPKVARSAMGAHFRLPVWSLSWEELRERILGMHLWVASSGGGRAYTEAGFRPPLALIVGSEAEGPTELAFQLAEPVHIPMPGGFESLNAAIATGILLFEIVRQLHSHPA